MNACSYDACARKVKGYGLCENHLKRWRRGTYAPAVEPVRRYTEPGEERLRRYVEVTGFCWHWVGALDRHGYGVTASGRAHRWVYEFLVGQIPDGLDLDHLCRVRRCVNPDHLEPTSRQVNLLRGSRSMLARTRVTCGNGHDLTVPGSTCQRGSRTRCRECELARGRRARERARATLAP